MIVCERDNVFRLRMMGSLFSIRLFFVMYLLIIKAIGFVEMADD
jgi:hypothetical protein